MTHFEAATTIAAPPWRVFDVSLEVETHLASMAGSHEQVIGGVTSGRMTLGDTVTWPVTGPFRRWRHAHHFEPDGNRGTVVRDIVDYAAPFGPLGAIAELTLLDWYMPRLIRVRNDHVKAAAETNR